MLSAHSSMCNAELLFVAWLSLHRALTHLIDMLKHSGISDWWNSVKVNAAQNYDATRQVAWWSYHSNPSAIRKAITPNHFSIDAFPDITHCHTNTATNYLCSQSFEHCIVSPANENSRPIRMEVVINRVLIEDQEYAQLRLSLVCREREESGKKGKIKRCERDEKREETTRNRTL